MALQTPAEIRISTGRLELAARRWGNPEGEPVLAIHGWLDNGASYDFLLPHFDLQRYQVVALDLPGHGWSDHRPPGESYHLLEYVRDIVAAAEALGWTEYRLLGHSLGGSLTMLVACAYPERVRQLVLLDALGPLTGAEKDGPGLLRQALDKSIQGSSPMSAYPDMDRAIAARQKGIGALSREAASAIVGRNIQQVAGGVQWRTDPRLRWPSYQRMTEGQVAEYLKAIQCPTLLLAGEQGMLKPGHPRVEARLSCIPRLMVEYVVGAHHLHMEPRPDLVARLIMEFYGEPRT